MAGERRGTVALMICVALVFIVLSVVIGTQSPALRPWLAAIWAVGVPMWFWAEYTFLVSEAEKNDAVAFNRFKYSQELASKIWVAVAAVLASLYLIK